MTTAATVLTPAALEFVRERHLASLSTLRADGSPHVVAVGFTWDAEAGLARVITDAKSVKARNVARCGYAAVNQVDGARWLTLEGPAAVLDDPAAVADAVDRYRGRYREPRVNPTRVALVITVTKVLAGASLRA